MLLLILIIKTHTLIVKSLTAYLDKILPTFIMVIITNKLWRILFRYSSKLFSLIGMLFIFDLSNIPNIFSIDSIITLFVTVSDYL